MDFFPESYCYTRTMSQAADILLTQRVLPMRDMKKIQPGPLSFIPSIALNTQ